MVIETERLRLRPFEAEELDEFQALHSDPEVTRFVLPLDRGQAEQRLADSGAEWRARGHGLFAITDRRSGAILGRCGLKYWPQFGETEIGWLLRRSEWGHGYATEAGGACLEWGFASLAVPYLTAMIAPDNLASIRVAERLEMAPLRTDVLLGYQVVVHKRDRPAHRSDSLNSQ